MKAIARFLKDVLVMRPAGMLIGAGLVVLAFIAMVGPFFGFTWPEDKPQEKPRGRGDNTSTV